MVHFFPREFWFFEDGLVSDIIANDFPVMTWLHASSFSLFLALYFLYFKTFLNHQFGSYMLRAALTNTWLCRLQFCQQTLAMEQPTTHRKRATGRQIQPEVPFCCSRRGAINVILLKNTSICKSQATILFYFILLSFFNYLPVPQHLQYSLPLSHAPSLTSGSHCCPPLQVFLPKALSATFFCHKIQGPNEGCPVPL